MFYYSTVMFVAVYLSLWRNVYVLSQQKKQQKGTYNNTYNCAMYNITPTC